MDYLYLVLTNIHAFLSSSLQNIWYIIQFSTCSQSLIFYQLVSLWLKIVADEIPTQL